MLALRLTCENVETKEEGTKIKSYRFKTLKKLFKSQFKGDINWLRPKFKHGRWFLKRNIEIMDQESTRIDLTIQIGVRQWTEAIVRWLSPLPRKMTTQRIHNKEASNENRKALC